MGNTAVLERGISTMTDRFSLFEAESSAPSMTAGDRFDTYWLHDNLWGRGARAYWSSRASVEIATTVLPNGKTIGSRQRTYEPQRVALEKLIRHAGRREKLSVLAAIIMWRTATTEQLQTLTGLTYRQVGLALHRLFDAGVIERGDLGATPPGAVPYLWTVRPGAELDQLLDRISTYDEWVSVTGGYGAGSVSRSGDRHNVLGTELALRIAEFLPPEIVGTVFPERFSARDLLAPHMATIDPIPASASATTAGDLTLVRSDGFRIVFEVTAGSDRRIADKMHRWMRTLGSKSQDELGLHVVFVESDSPDRSNEKQTRITTAYEKATSRGIGGPIQRERVAQGMSVARWSDWFPGLYQMDDSFRRLTASRATGPLGKSNRWEPVDLANLEFNPSNPAAWQAPIDNSHGLWGLAHWLRIDELRHTFAA